MTQMKQTNYGASLDRLSTEMNCLYMSDLHCLNALQRKYLSEKIEQMPVNDYSLQEWNDTLDYLTNAQAETTAEDAKLRLIALLSR